MQGHDITFAPAMALNQADAALEEGLSKFETYRNPPTHTSRVAQARHAHRSATGSSWRGGGSSGRVGSYGIADSLFGANCSSLCLSYLCLKVHWHGAVVNSIVDILSHPVQCVGG